MCELIKRFYVCDATNNYNIEIDKRAACIIYICSQLTPYLGKQLDGCVIYTILRGHIVYQNGKFAPPLGQLVLHSSLQNWKEFLEKNASLYSFCTKKQDCYT